MDAAGDLVDRETEGLRHQPQCLDGLGMRHTQVATGQWTRANVSEHDVGVGHGGFASSKAVASGAGIGSRAARSHLETTSRIEPGDTPTSCTNLGDVDARNP